MVPDLADQTISKYMCVCVRLPVCNKVIGGPGNAVYVLGFYKESKQL